MRWWRRGGLEVGRRVSTATPKEVAGGAVFGGLVAGTFGLGVWQTQRYFWKVDLMKERREALGRAPSAASAAEAASKTTFERSIVRGKFVGKEVLVGPRPPPAGLVPPAQGLGTGPIGYEVLAAFVDDESGTACVVNRGWTPRGQAPLEAPTSSVELVVLGDRGERRGTFSPANTPQQILWIELPFIAGLLGVRGEECPSDRGENPSDRGEKSPSDRGGNPIYLVALAESDEDEQGNKKKPSSWPKPRSAAQFERFNVEPPTHAAYAFTWFALSVAGAFMTRRLLFPKQQPRRRNIPRTTT